MKIVCNYKTLGASWYPPMGKSTNRSFYSQTMQSTVVKMNTDKLAYQHRNFQNGLS